MLPYFNILSILVPHHNLMILNTNCTEPSEWDILLETYSLLFLCHCAHYRNSLFISVWNLARNIVQFSCYHNTIWYYWLSTEHKFMALNWPMQDRLIFYKLPQMFGFVGFEMDYKRRNRYDSNQLLLYYSVFWSTSEKWLLYWTMCK